MLDPRITFKNRYFAGVLAFLLPGAGHVYQGRYFKGVLCGVCVLFTFCYGMALGNWSVVYWKKDPTNFLNPYYAQVFVGLPALPSLVQARRYESRTNVDEMSIAGPINELQLSSSNIINENGIPATIKLLASDTDFIGPVAAINNSASLTFNQNIGAPASTLSFWADPLNAQGANPTNTPGTLLESVSGSASTDPDSFSGSLISPFNALGPYSMTEGASLSLRGLGSITGFNQSMESTSPIPEPSTWAMLLMGFGGLAFGAYSRRRVRELY